MGWRFHLCGFPWPCKDIDPYILLEDLFRQNISTTGVWYAGFCCNTYGCHFLGYIFGCFPVNLNWVVTPVAPPGPNQHPPTGGYCVDVAALIAAQAGLNLATDVWILCLPMKWLFRMKRVYAGISFSLTWAYRAKLENDEEDSAYRSFLARLYVSPLAMTNWG